MKMKRPAALASISLLTVGGLYYGLFRPSPELIGHTKVAREPEAVPARIQPTENASVTPALPNEKLVADRETSEPGSAGAEVRASTAGSAEKQTIASATPSIPSPAGDRKSSRPADAPGGQVAETRDEPARAPVGIRLAPDVRLPVAAMPNDLKLNPIKQKALQDIVDEYYQTVAAAVSVPQSNAVAGTAVAGENGGEAAAPTDSADSADPADPDDTLVVEENGEQTRVVTNSPAVDAARKRADLRFKALFGHAAYNRMTMNTLLESRLPLVKTEQ